MNTDTKIIIGAIAASILIIVGAVVILSQDKSPQRETLGEASLRIDKQTEDFGSMKVSEEKTATFTITNTSSATLRLWNVTTSCNCTFASVIIGKDKTGEFSMHAGSLKNWIGEVPPSQNALLTVTYRPSVMPVQGPVSRQVTFATNDPKNPEMTVNISANVQ